MPRMGSRRTVPSRRHYLAGTSILVVGVSLFVLLLFLRIERYTPHIRAVVPGTHHVELDRPGKYTVFYEHRSVIEGRFYFTGDTLSGILVRIAPADGSEPRPLSRPANIRTYDARGRAGGSTLEFDIDKPGTYELTAVYADNADRGDIVLAIGQYSVFRTVLSLLFLLLGGVLIGGFVIVRAYVWRRGAHGKTAETGEGAR